MSGAIAQRANDDDEGTRREGVLSAGDAQRVRAVAASATSASRSTRTCAAAHDDVIVANGAYLGGGMKICPEAEPDDGVFDVLLIGDLTKRDLMLTLPKTYRGTHLPHPKAEILRGRGHGRSAVAAAGRARRRAAGNDAGAVRVVPRALKVRVPR